MSQYDYDVAVIGGGPAGAATAAYLAKAGLRCVVLEAQRFPRPHVGESLVPSSTRIFAELGFLEQMESAGFRHKFGAAWTSSLDGPLYSHDWKGLQSDGQANIRFAARAQDGVDQEYTYHVDRAIFDDLLLQHAQRLGAAVRQDTRVLRVDFSEASRPRLEVRSGAAKESIGVKMVVDASGRNTLLGRQLGLKVNDPVFDQYALHTWFEGYDRREFCDEAQKEDFIFVHFLPLSNSWVWQIPITETVTSIGVVTQRKHFAKSRQERRAFFWETVGSRPELREALERAHQVRPIKEEGDYSYSMKEICGDGFVLIGDAARFVDPIFSSGVSVALTSAKFAAEDILRAAATGSFAKESFDRFSANIRQGTSVWYQFISMYYRLNVLFTAFVQDERYRLDVLRLLQGDVYDEEPPSVLSVMRETIAEVEANPGHPWHRYLGDLRADTMQPSF